MLRRNIKQQRGKKLRIKITEENKTVKQNHPTEGGVFVRSIAAPQASCSDGTRLKALRKTWIIWPRNGKKGVKRPCGTGSLLIRWPLKHWRTQYPFDKHLLKHIHYMHRWGNHNENSLYQAGVRKIISILHSVVTNHESTRWISYINLCDIIKYFSRLLLCKL